MTDYLPSSPSPSSPRDVDGEHLRLLSIFHYVLAGISALFSLFPMLHVFIGMLMVLGGIKSRGQGGEEMAVGGLFFIVMPLCCFVLPGLVTATFFLMAGRRLATMRGYTFCLVVAAISCIFFPLGTILGVFTIVVLNRPSVKQLFDQNAAQQAGDVLIR